MPAPRSSENAERAAVLAWYAQFTAAQPQLERVIRDVADGKTPRIPQGLGKIVDSARTLFGVDAGLAVIIALTLQAGSQAQQAAYKAAVTSLPPHVRSALSQAVTETGLGIRASDRAVAAIVNKQVKQLTGDYGRMSMWARAQLRRDIAAGLREGKNPREVAQTLEGYIQDWFRQGQARSQMIARTTMTRAYDIANRDVYIDAADRGLIKGWQWRSNRSACQVCASLNGMIFEPGEDTYRHPNCMCWTVPVLIDEAGQPGERLHPFPGTSRDDVYKKTHNGWTNWTLKPKDERQGTWKPYKKTPRNKFLPDRIPKEMADTA